MRFGRLLRDHGFAVSTPSILDALAAVKCVGIEHLQDFKAAIKAVFMTRAEETSRFDQLFDEFWVHRFITKKEASDGTSDAESTLDGVEGEPESAEIFVTNSGLPPQEQEPGSSKSSVVYSPAEALRHQDFRHVPEGRDEQIAVLIEEIIAPLVRRTAARRRLGSSGVQLDFRRLMRRHVAYGGELFEFPRLRPKPRIRKLVFLCDVSGSMNRHLQFMLRFIKGLQGLPTRVETFVFATRLHRITHVLKRLPFPRAMDEIAKTAPDWSGGTRIGPCLQEFTSIRGGAMLGSSTVVLIFSDGWDRGEPELLRKEMTTINRSCYRVLWINPLLGGPSYEPTCRGMRTALPFVDLFLPGHNLRSFEMLVGTLRGIII
jgi:uncharacterized protein